MQIQVTLQPSWISIQQNGLHQQLPGLIQLVAFFYTHLPAGWRVYVRPFWGKTQFDLILIHDHVGVIFYTVQGDKTLSNQSASAAPSTSPAPSRTPTDLQKLCNRLLGESMPDLYQLLKEKPQLKRLFRFGLYCCDITTAQARLSFPMTSTLHIVCGNDIQTASQLTDLVPLQCSTRHPPAQLEWLPKLALRFRIDNDYWPANSTAFPAFPTNRLPKSIFVDAQRTQAIRQICERRKITRLIHFTHVKNLSSILKRGLLSRAYLDKLRVTHHLTVNDQRRADQQTLSCSLSISFPNYRMFYRLRQEAPADWVILAIESSILWELDCAFCTSNAAKILMNRTPITERQAPSALEQMFADIPGKSRASINLPEWFPTDPQAEVLVFDPIEPRYIQAVHFKDHEARLKWQKSHSSIGAPPLLHEPVYFSPRCDYAAWKDETSIES